MTNIDYSLWPNADGNLGDIKVQIPDGVNVIWPAGDALVGNFIYNDGKLAGFVDTKALILNESATTTFPYDYVDISLPSIQEGTLTINRGERCKYLNVKIYRADWLPVGFTELEYLESSGTQWIDTGVTTPTNTWMSAKVYLVRHWDAYPQIYGVRNRRVDDTGVELYDIAVNSSRGHIIRPNFTPNWQTIEGEFTVEIAYRSLKVNGEEIGYFGSQLQANVNAVNNMYLFAGNTLNDKASDHSASRIWYFKLYNDAEILCDLIPVLDADGTPCMYDKISNQCLYNQGKGTFGYRIKTTDNNVAPLSLRDPYYVAPSGVYAKLIAENELEIVADTEEVQGDDWVHFANTGEAYEHFGITFEDETLE